MRNLFAAAIVVLVGSWAAVAAADAMPACPEGQHLEHNPSTPGSGHHAGGRCVENDDGCSVGGTAGSGVAVLAGIGVIGVLVWRRRRGDV